MASWTKAFSGQPQRPDLGAIVASGLFDECASAVAAVAAAGVDGQLPAGAAEEMFTARAETSRAAVDD